MRLRNIIWCVALVLVGCASSVEKAPDKEQIKAFYIKQLTVNLSESVEAIPGSKQFASESKLSKDFAYSIHKNLVEAGIYASMPGPNVAELDITIDYLRRYKIGGRALSRPLVSHQVIISQGNQKIAKLTQKNYTPLYGYFKAVYVNIERAIHQWDEKDEHIDAENISESLVEDLERKYDL
ncbi:hypothetical protein [Marinomonas pollencensis]|uniref:Lipoprotein n=1 Tax=Marinomonas pollencensis TaxID=491954 RepID=A0A3E0DLH7_9GAMM|nr:hypothetical protein [Marinomonas pollencensis]REG83690.1 hypothetical protein DFP81_10556 [Marinomonas pollencensis]